jgi:nucleoid-associated protein YgaU
MSLVCASWSSGLKSSIRPSGALAQNPRGDAASGRSIIDQEDTMGIISFFKEAGEKLFGSKDTEAAAQQAKAAPDNAALQAQAAQANEVAAKAIADYIGANQLTADGLSVAFDGASSAVTVSGVAADQATKEKILLCCGNVTGVGQVNDLLTVSEPADESQYHTVVRGDTLSAIAKKFYGNANAYPKIFEANKPMLTHPDKIYPGQLLRIPPA